MTNQPLDWQYIFTCSDNELSEWQLAAMSRYSQLLKQAKQTASLAIEQAVIAEILCQVRTEKEFILAEAKRTLEAQAVLAFVPHVRKSA